MRWGVLVAIACAILLPATAAAASPSVTRVVSRDSALPEPETSAQVEEHQLSIAKEVKRALAEGKGKELLETENPDILGDVLRYGHVKGRSEGVKSNEPKEKGAPKAPRAPEASFNRCYPEEKAHYAWGTSFGTIAWLRVVVAGGWCGIAFNKITYAPPPTEATFPNWHAFGLCFTDRGTAWSWDGPTGRWIHAAQWAHLGSYYKIIGCVGIKGGKAVIRIAANGYWDEYNDFGF